MLGELGHKVICAPNAGQALHVLRSDSPLEVLLTDVIMPGGMDGVGLAQRVAAPQEALSSK